MASSYQRITIIKIRKPLKKDINDELQWLGASLGLFNLRDKDKSCFRIFVELLKISKKGVSISSDELAFKAGLSRGTVIHHINKLIDAGLVVTNDRKYILRENKLAPLIDELENDMKRTYNTLKEIAKDIDNKI
ncbi:winged helix-turn-helix transcriptional regulator [Candidatus Woesearchaeota archaeon]|nr:winged helix-turn-helix transcriptional regulator [Candidatus Woesearchaeota archaeon]